MQNLPERPYTRLRRFQALTVGCPNINQVKSILKGLTNVAFSEVTNR